MKSLKFYDSFKAMRYSDATVDFVKFVDAKIHDLLKIDFNQQDRKLYDANVFFKHPLGEYSSEKNSVKASFFKKITNWNHLF